MFEISLKKTERENIISDSYLQSIFWSEFKSRNGWKYECFKAVCKLPEEHTFFITVLLRRIKFFGIFAYVPMAPNFLVNEDSLSEQTAIQRENFLSALSVLLKKNLPPEVFLLRFDPPWGTETENACGKTDGDEKKFSNFPLKPVSKKIIKPSYDVQPPDTVILNLTLTEEELLMQFKQKWRYNIRLAEKKGVSVKSFYEKNVTDKEIDIFYSLYEETAKRDGIGIHSKEYYRSFFETANDYSQVRAAVHIAEYENEPLAAIITVFYASEAVYLYGASSNKNRNLMSAYLLQWKAITAAKKHGCKSYDFYGIPPFENPRHPMYGLYRFKTGFGGKIIHRVGSLDFPCRSTVLYKLYTAAETLRAFRFKKLKKIFR